jgi:hypothetical protein
MRPEIYIVAIDATSNYSQQMVDEYGRIFDIYYFNINEVTHCCEITPSYCLEYVASYCEKQPEDELLREKMYDDLQEANLFSEGGYYHCNYIDSLRCCLLDDFSTHDPEDYEANLDDFVREWCRPDEFYHPELLPFS